MEEGGRGGGGTHLAMEAVAVSSFFSFNNSMQRSTKVLPMQISVLRVAKG
jgi:hypothetical protein